MTQNIILAAVMAVTLAGGLSAEAGAAVQQKQAPMSKGDDPSKFFVFHQQGVSFETAKEDYGYCIDQSKGILSMRDKMGNITGGLLGGLINDRMGETDRVRMRNAAMRKCMGLLGYARYKMPAAEWDVLVKKGDIVLGDDGLVDHEVVDRLARYASGPDPKTERLLP